jgi:hypothetical protein
MPFQLPNALGGCPRHRRYQCVGGNRCLRVVRPTLERELDSTLQRVGDDGIANLVEQTDLNRTESLLSTWGDD